MISGDVQSVFSKPYRLGLLGYTIESAVLKFPTEFFKQAHERAAFRIRIVEGDKPGADAIPKLCGVPDTGFSY